MTFCPKCRNNVSEYDNFCTICGEKIQNSEVQALSETKPQKYHKYDSKLIPIDILTSGEVPLFETRPILWIRFISPILFIILGIIPFAVAYGYLKSQGYEWTLYGCFGVFLFGLLWIILRLLSWRYIFYAATNKRVLEQRGMIGKNYVDCTLDKIQNVYLYISILGRIFGYGTISMSTAGAAWIEIHWLNIKHPRYVQRILNETIENFRQSRS